VLKATTPLFYGETAPAAKTAPEAKKATTTAK